MRKKPIKLQYIRPQTEVFDSDFRPFMAKVSFYGDAGEGELETIIEEAKESNLDMWGEDSYGEWEEYSYESSYDVWEKQ